MEMYGRSVIPKSQGGKDTKENRQLLHRHCHDNKTARDGSYNLAAIEAKPFLDTIELD